jgi:predicted nucleotidyltransferase
LQTLSLPLLKSRLDAYNYVDPLISLVQQIKQHLEPDAVILFGSLARGNYYVNQSDADMCVVLTEPEVELFDGYCRVAELDREGISQPLVFGREQFLKMLEDANPLGLEICDNGLVLAGREEFVQQLRVLFDRVREKYQIQRTESGWYIGKPV